MNTASLELCKELYELSKWFDTDYKHYEINGKYELRPSVKITDDWGGEGRNVLSMLAPAYDLGYLLRKLPPQTTIKHTISNKQEFYLAEYQIGTVGNYTQGTGADTPEYAACKLAIELWKQGVLK